MPKELRCIKCKNIHYVGNCPKCKSNLYLCRETDGEVFEAEKEDYEDCDTFEEEDD